MKQYYGNYLGIVISGGEKDPEGRGRCQVFIPHIMPSLYEGWNREGEDINFEVIGDGLPTALSPAIVDKLKKVLPWAECAAPIVGSSPSVKNGSETIRNTGGTSSKEGFSISDLENRFEGAISNAPGAASSYIRNTPWSAGFISYVAGINSPTFPRAGLHTAYATAVRNGQAEGWTALNPSTTQVQPGDIVIKNRGGNSLTWDGSWTGFSHGDVVTSVNGNTITTVGGNVGDSVSETNVTTTNGVINSANYFAVLRPPANIANNIANTAEQEFNKWSANGWNERTSQALGTLASYYDAGNLPVPPGINPSGIAGGANPVDTNMKPDPTQETGQNVEGFKALAQDRQTRFGQEISNNQEQILSRIQALANREVGSTLTAQQAFIETIINRAYFSNRSIDTIIYEDAYGFRGNDTATPSASLRDAFNNVINGSNITSLATDAGYNLPGAGPGGSNFVTGNPDKQVTGIMDLQTGQFVTDQSLIDKLNTEGDRSGRYEYFVRQDRATTRAGIEQYAQENNISQNIAIASNSTIQNPTQFQRNDGPDTNYQALGMFGYASEGTTVWTFFREGNPLFPVYFAASYGQREWKNMYSYSSPGIGAGAGTGAVPGTEKMRMNSYGGGFESAQVTENTESGLDPQFTFQVYGKNGSNLLFTKDHTEFNSTYNHNQRVSGDFHEITEANKETRVRGDKNTYVEQDVYVTIGNWSDEAIAASDEIQQYINEAMEIKSNAGKA